MKKLLMIVNPAAGKTRSHGPLFDAVSVFCNAGYLVRVYHTTGRGDAARVAAEEGNGYDVVVCCGGDGTLNETINGLLACGKNIPIGYIPAGSTNDFAASLHLPSEPLKAAEAILDGKPIAYDVGDFGGRRFSYVASFGAFTKSSYSTPQNIKNALGHTAYILSGIQEISQLHTTHMRLELDGEVIEDDFLFGAISNSTSVGGILTLDPRQVDLQDGKFELFLVRVPRNLTELSECIQALQSQKYNCSAITFRSASQLTVSSPTPLTWTLDGERAYTDGPVEICNLHHAIRLMTKG